MKIEELEEKLKNMRTYYSIHKCHVVKGYIEEYEKELVSLQQVNLIDFWE